MMRKYFVVMEAIFLAGAFFSLYFLSQPRLVAPSSGLVIDELDFNFEIEHAERIEISSTPSFDEVIAVERGREAVLVPGTYYWRAVSLIGKSEVRDFTITAKLVLSLSDHGKDYEVLNRGNVDAQVIRNKDSVIIPSKSTSRFAKEEGNFEGRQAG